MAAGDLDATESAVHAASRLPVSHGHSQNLVQKGGHYAELGGRQGLRLGMLWWVQWLATAWALLWLLLGGALGVTL